MKRVIGLVVILCLLCFVGNFIQKAQAGGPKLLIPETGFDYGYAPPKSVLSHYYLVKNLGTDSLKIKDVKPG
jgi:hypothetical protein